MVGISRWKFKILDTACLKKHKKIFFTPDYTTKSYGTGLGMAIVRRIITVHGGGIAVESELKVGTKICITFDESSYLSDTQPALIPLKTKSIPQE